MAYSINLTFLLKPVSYKESSCNEWFLFRYVLEQIDVVIVLVLVYGAIFSFPPII
jgi:hypothetical protein